MPIRTLGLVVLHILVPSNCNTLAKRAKFSISSEVNDFLLLLMHTLLTIKKGEIRKLYTYYQEKSHEKYSHNKKPQKNWWEYFLFIPLA